MCWENRFTARNSKSEIRMPKPDRNPKSETRIETLVTAAASYWASAAAGVPPAVEPGILPGGLSCGLLRHFRVRSCHSGRQDGWYLFSGSGCRAATTPPRAAAELLARTAGFAGSLWAAGRGATRRSATSSTTLNRYPGEGEARTAPGNSRTPWCGIASWGLKSGATGDWVHSESTRPA